MDLSDPSKPQSLYVYEDAPRKDILRMIPRDGTTIGSVGCGWGATEAVLMREGRAVHGVDISEAAITVARSRLTSARVIAPGDHHVFEDESLDGLILADVIEHIPLAWTALSSFSRAVKRGGWVVISVPNMQSLNVVVQLMLLGDWPEKKIGIFDETHIQMMTRKRLVRWAAAAGLVPIAWYDSYEDHWRGRAQQAVDRLTLRVLHDWLSYQWQCLFRRAT